MTELLHRDLTDIILGAYFEVYNHTSRTFPESIFECAMIKELRWRGQEVTQQDAYQILYKGHKVGVQQLDLFVMREVAVENKVAEHITPLHKAQGISYLKTVGKKVGLLLNFGSERPEFERIYFDPDRRHPVETSSPPSSVSMTEDLLYPELAYQIVGGLYEVHRELGPGFIHRIYANACYRELQLQGVDVQPFKQLDVQYKGVVVGSVAFGHLLVMDRVMVFPTAYQNSQAIHLDTLKHWMHQRGIRLGILANFWENQLGVTFVLA